MTTDPNYVTRGVREVAERIVARMTDTAFTTIEIQAAIEAALTAALVRAERAETERDEARGELATLRARYEPTAPASPAAK